MPHLRLFCGIAEKGEEGVSALQKGAPREILQYLLQHHAHVCTSMKMEVAIAVAVAATKVRHIIDYELCGR